MTTNRAPEGASVCDRCGEWAATRNAVVGDSNSAHWCDACMATTDDVWSACAACGADVVTAGVPVGRVYCAECVQSGQAAYDVADRAGDRAAMATAEGWRHAGCDHGNGYCAG